MSPCRAEGKQMCGITWLEHGRELCTPVSGMLEVKGQVVARSWLALKAYGWVWMDPVGMGVASLLMNRSMTMTLMCG